MGTTSLSYNFTSCQPLGTFAIEFSCRAALILGHLLGPQYVTPATIRSLVDERLCTAIPKSAAKRHALGGILGVQAPASTYGITGPVVCAGTTPWKIAQALDILLDDGASDTGNVRAGAAGGANLATVAAASAVYGPAFVTTAANTAGQHTVCMKI